MLIWEEWDLDDVDNPSGASLLACLSPVSLFFFDTVIGFLFVLQSHLVELCQERLISTVLNLTVNLLLLPFSALPNILWWLVLLVSYLLPRLGDYVHLHLV